MRRSIGLQVVVAVAALVLRWSSATAPATSLSDLPDHVLQGIVQRLPLQAQLRLAATAARFAGLVGDDVRAKWLEEVLDPAVSDERLRTLILHYPHLPVPSLAPAAAAICPGPVELQVVALHDRVQDAAAFSEVRAELLGVLLRRLPHRNLIFSLVVAGFASVEPRGQCRPEFGVVPAHPASLLDGPGPDPAVYAAFAASLPAEVIAIVTRCVESVDRDNVAVPASDLPAAIVDGVRALYPPPFDQLVPFNGALADTVFAQLLLGADLGQDQERPSSTTGPVRPGPVLAGRGVAWALLMLGLRPSVAALVAGAARPPAAVLALARPPGPDLFPTPVELRMLSGAPGLTSTLVVHLLRRRFEAVVAALPALLAAAPFAVSLRRHPGRLLAVVLLLVQSGSWPLLEQIVASGLFREAELANCGLQVAYHLMAVEADGRLPDAGRRTFMQLLRTPQVGLARTEAGVYPILALLFGNVPRLGPLPYHPDLLDWIAANLDAFRSHCRQSPPEQLTAIESWLAGGPGDAVQQRIAAAVQSPAFA